MKKILKVIETCHDCFHCKIFEYRNDNYTVAQICDFARDTGSENHLPFLLEITTSKDSTALIIPENCPLEDYKSDKK